MELDRGLGTGLGTGLGVGPAWARPDSKELWPQDLVVTESWIAEISGTS